MFLFVVVAVFEHVGDRFFQAKVHGANEMRIETPGLQELCYLQTCAQEFRNIVSDIQCALEHREAHV